jgi:hypothetical protein
MNYSDFQNEPSSEKITLVRMEAAKRLMGWTLTAGSVYSIPFEYTVLAGIEDGSVALTSVDAIEDLVAGKYYFDRSAAMVYVWTHTGAHPNGRFLIARIGLNFANVPIALPHDLLSGYEVFFEPLVQSTSTFGVEIDTINQTAEAIEGSGQLTFHNDSDFWPSNFDTLYFENQSIYVYSFHRDLAPSEARLIFSGTIESKAYNATKITFKLRDLMSELTAPLDLANIEDLAERTSEAVALAKQRMIIGRVFSHRPVNMDEVLDGYPITGTVSIDVAATTLIGVGTEFLSECSPDDRLLLNGTEYTVASVTNNTAIELTEAYSGASDLTGASTSIIPDQPKRTQNRRWICAGHSVREPQTTTEAGSTISRLIVSDSSDIYPNDWINVGTPGSGYLVQVNSVTGVKVLNLRTSLPTIPAIGTLVTRPSIQNVRLNDFLLTHYRDFDFDAETATLTLSDSAEQNAAPIKYLSSTLSFTNGSRSVISGESVKSIVKPGHMIGVEGNAIFFEVLSVPSETEILLRENATFTVTAQGRYKSYIFDPSADVLSLDMLGRTDDGTPSGSLLKTAPAIVRALLIDLGLEDQLDQSTFTEAESIAPQHLGAVWPKDFSQTRAPSHREVINEINKSVFGSLIQNSDFKLCYSILEPRKDVNCVKFDESDILSMAFESQGRKIIKTSVVEYFNQEYNYLAGGRTTRSSQKDSDISELILKSNDSRTFSTLLVNESDAKIIVRRWSFILENGAGRVTLKTKLKGMSVDVGNIIEVSHRKLFYRFGLTAQTRLFLVESVKRSGSEVLIEAVDLSGAFTRAANWGRGITNFLMLPIPRKSTAHFSPMSLGLSTTIQILLASIFTGRIKCHSHHLQKQCSKLASLFDQKQLSKSKTTLMIMNLGFKQ